MDVLPTYWLLYRHSCKYMKGPVVRRAETGEDWEEGGWRKEEREREKGEEERERERGREGGRVCVCV